MHRVLFMFFCFLMNLVCQAQNDDSLLIRRIADEVLTNGTAYSNLHTLTKTVGGRINGSAQTYKAASWGQKALTDAGANKVFLQECKIPHWVRGGKDIARMIEGNKETALNVLALGNSVGTGPRGIN